MDDNPPNWLDDEMVDTKTGEIIPASVSQLDGWRQKVELTPTGLTFTGKLTFDEYGELAAALDLMESGIQWWKGDQLNYGERQYGDLSAQAETDSREYQTLINYANVASKIGFNRRRLNLDWSHHAEVAALPPNMQDEILDWAEEPLCNGSDRPRSTREVRGRVIEYKRNQRREERTEDNDRHSPHVQLGDMRELSADIPDDSIDMIFTDPPYPQEYLPLFGDLAEVAARVLKPGGICMAYSGQIFLPDVMALLGRELEYLWTCAIRHTGGNQRMFKPNVNTAWKPILWYIKPPREVYWDSFIDMTSGGREKDLHGWQQAEAEAAYFIEKLSPPGGTILDPFCGSGTTLVAALRLGRVPIGFDVDPVAVEKAERRLHDETA